MLLLFVSLSVNGLKLQGHMQGYQLPRNVVATTAAQEAIEGAESERGGPELDFHLLPEKPGFLKFYVQVQLGGKDVYAGFGLDVEPAPMAMDHQG